MKPGSKLARKYAVLAGVFVVGAGLGLAARKKIRFPFKNPWNVTGPLTLIKFSPTNNLVRYAVVVILPTVLFFLLLQDGARPKAEA